MSEYAVINTLRVCADYWDGGVIGACPFAGETDDEGVFHPAETIWWPFFDLRATGFPYPLHTYTRRSAAVKMAQRVLSERDRTHSRVGVLDVDTGLEEAHGDPEELAPINAAYADKPAAPSPKVRKAKERGWVIEVVSAVTQFSPGVVTEISPPL